MLSYGLIVPLIHILFAAPVLFYAGYCLNCPKKCVSWFPNFLMGLAVVIGLFHLYNFVSRVRLVMNEGFDRQGGYLGRPEPFVPFSYPYQKETDRYYSYHDDEHTRNCNCEHNDGHQGCHQSHICNHTAPTEEIAEPFDTVSPVDNSKVGSGLWLSLNKKKNLDNYTNLDNGNSNCKYARDGVSGCRDCCSKYKNYARCVSYCMNN